MSQKHLTDQRFIEFNLEESLQQGLRDAGFAYCTPIQAACLPSALEGKDVAGQAQTGTGKTVAFLLACCHYLLTHPPQSQRLPTEPRALILAPTRELAIQIYRDAEVLSKHTGFTLGLVYGGTGYEEQKTMLATGADILIGTPGRLIDFFKQGLYDLKHAQVAVLDEADRMFDLGFIRDIRFLLRRMPPADNRLNLLFSATLSFKVMELAYEHMNNPEEIKIESDAVVVAEVTEYSFYPAEEEKLPLLVNLLKRDNHERILVFVNTRHGVEKVADVLSANSVSNGALSGDVPQRKREQLLDSFKRGDRKVLVATDVAARGLHIPDVSHVYNFDLPQDADDYIHRIGRTARAGASGEAISFVCERYAYSIMDIEESIGHALPRRDVGPELLQEIQRAPASRSRGRKERGERGSPGRGRPPKSPSAAISNPTDTERAHHQPDRNHRPSPDSLADPLADSLDAQAELPVESPVDSPIQSPAGEASKPTPAVAQPEAASRPTGEPVPADVPKVAPTTVPRTVPAAITPKTVPTSAPAAVAPPTVPTSAPAKVADKHPAPARQRFSRRYGEIPVVG